MYDLDPLSESDLRNVSTRGYVADQEDVLIGGFTLGTNQGPVKILLRAHGVCLKNWGLKEVLSDPMLHLHDANGTQLIANDNWKEDPLQAQEIEQSTIPPDDIMEAGAVITLQPGAYTVIVDGKNHTIGNGIVRLAVTVVVPFMCSVPAPLNVDPADSVTPDRKNVVRSLPPEMVRS